LIALAAPTEERSAADRHDDQFRDSRTRSQGGPGSSGDRFCSTRCATCPVATPILAQDLGVSEREAEGAAEVFASKNPKQIARDLASSEHKVRTHLKAIYAKPGVKSKADLVRRGYWPSLVFSPREADLMHRQTREAQQRISFDPH